MRFIERDYRDAADSIRARSNNFEPEVVIVLGSGLGGVAGLVEDAVIISYAEIPHFPRSTAPTHKGQLCLGRLRGRRVAVMQGRMHYYEGHSAEDTVFALRVLRLMGASTLVITNAAGGVNTEYRPGDIMLIRDHIKLTSVSPLRGPNLDFLGLRFPDMSTAYTPALLKRASEVAGTLDIPVREGVYFYMSGPQYETPAEIRALRALGGDAVGMSTVYEVIAARHAGMEILGLSVISNMAAGILDQPITMEEVEIEGKKAQDNLARLICGLLEE